MRTKLRKALYQTRVKLLTCFYRKILLDTYFTSIIYHTTDQHKNFLLFTKIQFGKPVQHLQLPQHREGKIDQIPSSSTSSYFIGFFFFLYSLTISQNTHIKKYSNSKQNLDLTRKKFLSSYLKGVINPSLLQSFG